MFDFNYISFLLFFKIYIIIGLLVCSFVAIGYIACLIHVSIDVYNNIIYDAFSHPLSSGSLTSIKLIHFLTHGQTLFSKNVSLNVGNNVSSRLSKDFYTSTEAYDSFSVVFDFLDDLDGTYG